jgi:hypothetical protein
MTMPEFRSQRYVTERDSAVGEPRQPQMACRGSLNA